MMQQRQIDQGNEWAVILAGGDGTRLKSLTRKIAGDERPKQFCSVLGATTLLEETQRRAALEFSRERIVYVVNRVHESYYRPILARESSANLVIQPRNAGTAPAILYSLLRIASTDPEAIVAVFPSDHYISDNRKFMAHIRTALDTARQRRDLIVLLGLEPESPEVEYGWIEPNGSLKITPGVLGVRRFWEKPNPVLAEVLQLRGCLWNSFVMVASVQALLETIESTTPELYRAFACMTPLFGTRAEPRAIDNLYERLDEVNFSHRVLALCPERLAVLKVAGVRWNDLGEPKRVLASLALAGLRPDWVDTAQPQFA
ncbi:MAG TPA: sugar phosphate nucleotidyltransferase [Candidatus Binatia bacterium]|jgi:mannose-1-phosphate guanylyltransferase|nr:sugar phosphate nucleotidyltransferase [Candidatus Binatia bacterium]